MKHDHEMMQIIWQTNLGWTTLELILKLAGFEKRSTGYSTGYEREHHAYWFDDDGYIYYYFPVEETT